jgi:hypothetical protein
MTKISNQYSLTNILTADLANSRLGINNVSPAYSLDVTGTARVTGVSTFSDNVGINTTPPTWFTNFKGLNLANGSFVSYTTNGSVFLTQNSYFNAAGSWTYINTGTAGQYSINGTGDHLWYTAVSGTAGAATSLTERMRITSGGNVGIGTSSPSEKLDVTGSIKASSGVYGNFHEGEFGQVLASTPYAGSSISKNLAELDPGIYLINAYMMRGGSGINQTYSVLWYYMHLSGFGGGSDAISAIYNNPGPQNNDGRIALTGSGYTVEITWGGARGPAGVTATKLRDAY